ncbi:rod shape-determining protein RodA [Alicyclobacillus contaminans]|uniref:FtsW/RodA/SpoVE family cell cycle protein n=1 Tax=Alicyclobacillus contaminans TaxID=392016 RepID=UPI00040BB11B|nr:FtsW/RodA/SpoVE family cell cycle protein [Alicyclobacillus contaminans]GMA49794.1 rod shape-determining protein RodA [Alicyclobacillus contaminans]
MEGLQRYLREMDYAIVALVGILLAYSCVAIAGVHNPLMPSHAWLKQLVVGILGLVVMFLTAFYDYRLLRRIHWWVYGVTTVLLIVVFAFPAVNYAHSWINLKVTTFQPSEFAKLALIISTAALMANVDESELPDYRLRTSWPFWAVLIPPFVLTLKEPALGQALVMVSISLIMFTTFTKRTWFVVSCVVVLMFGIVLVTVPMFYAQEAATFVHKVLIPHHLLKGYQGERILAWLDPSYNLSSSGFNVHQAQMAIGSGQMFGEGALNGLLSLHSGVPNEWTDYIFSSVGEQFGFVGSAGLILCFLALIYRLTRIARSATDTFGLYMVVGILGMFSFQVFENVGMDMYLSPSTGITLPFISYGGSSLLANFIAVGIALSVSLRYKPLRFN